MTPGPNEDHDPLASEGENEENEVLRAVREQRRRKEAADAAEAAEGRPGKRSIGWKAAAAAGIGIGSAAVLAALLYANRDKK